MCVSSGRVFQRFLTRAEAIRALRESAVRSGLELDDDPEEWIPLPGSPETENDWLRFSNEALAVAFFERTGENVTVIDSAVS